MCPPPPTAVASSRKANSQDPFYPRLTDSETASQCTFSSVPPAILMLPGLWNPLPNRLPSLESPLLINEPSLLQRGYERWLYNELSDKHLTMGVLSRLVTGLLCSSHVFDRHVWNLEQYFSTNSISVLHELLKIFFFFLAISGNNPPRGLNTQNSGECYNCFADRKWLQH